MKPGQWCDSYEADICDEGSCDGCGWNEVGEQPEQVSSDSSDGLSCCPFCGTTQIQLIANYSNRQHDEAKCRHCKATAKVTAWQIRTEPKEFPY